MEKSHTHVIIIKIQSDKNKVIWIKPCRNENIGLSHQSVYNETTFRGSLLNAPLTQYRKRI